MVGPEMVEANRSVELVSRYSWPAQEKVYQLYEVFEETWSVSDNEAGKNFFVGSTVGLGNCVKREGQEVDI
jgi:hypothetical protein